VQLGTFHRATHFAADAHIAPLELDPATSRADLDCVPGLVLTSPLSPPQGACTGLRDLVISCIDGCGQRGMPLFQVRRLRSVLNSICYACHGMAEHISASLLLTAGSLGCSVNHDI